MGQRIGVVLGALIVGLAGGGPYYLGFMFGILSTVLILWIADKTDRGE